MSICGKDCSITVSGSTGAFEGYEFTIDVQGQETPIRTFNGADYPDYVVCEKAGTINVKTYLDPSVSVGDTATVSCTVGGTTYVATDAVCTTKSMPVPANGVVTFDQNFRIVSDITNF